MVNMEQISEGVYKIPEEDIKRMKANEERRARNRKKSKSSKHLQRKTGNRGGAFFPDDSMILKELDKEAREAESLEKMAKKLEGKNE